MSELHTRIARGILFSYWRLMRLDKPIGVFLLLWPALWSLWIAGNGKPDLLISMVIVAGVIVMRSAGCVINDYADREFDPHVERTRLRPIAAGEIAPNQALLFFLLLILLAFDLTLLLNALTILLSVIGAFLAASYPFMKRYTHLPQAYLGIAFGWAVPMSFAAQTGQVPAVAWWLFLAVVLWALIYDTLYAMVDRDDDVTVGVKSTAILFGRHVRSVVAGLQALMLLVLGWVGIQAGLGSAYYAGLSVGAGCFVWQQYLVRDEEKSACFRAFLHNNWFGAAVFAGLAVDALL
ncbi:4-hydroxybenzoate octaprenyltransferase [Candidatus Methylospira mobilis]|uniref:4-hydroxybenzoate octaprenyltransferase n=1 Tax=Candidatus Methylospira mobilis TaxID=1808979 RepID=UPI002240F1B2|nr:4-hydroxybenzoate octaprenyltransferase [Candidatus Methylospira mobilis]